MDPAALTRRVLGRLLLGAVTALIVVTGTFFLMELSPGGLEARLDDPQLPRAMREQLREELGVGEPALERLGLYLSGLAHGELGFSVTRQRPVHEVIGAALGPSLLLAGCALGLAAGLGFVLGTLAASRPGSFVERWVRHAMPTLEAAPPFWIGLIGILVFSVHLGWLPAGHMRSATGASLYGGSPFLDLLAHLALPVLVLGVPGAAPFARHQWSALRDELRRPWMLSGLAQGVPRRRLVWRRATRAALQPFLALIGLALPVLVGGAVVVETVFSWPGMGRLHKAAIEAQDPPLALGGILLIALAVIVASLVADLLALWADPRLRAGFAPSLDP